MFWVWPTGTACSGANELEYADLLEAAMKGGSEKNHVGQFGVGTLVVSDGQGAIGLWGQNQHFSYKAHLPPSGRGFKAGIYFY